MKSLQEISGFGKIVFIVTFLGSIASIVALYDVLNKRKSEKELQSTNDILFEALIEADSKLKTHQSAAKEKTKRAPG